MLIVLIIWCTAYWYEIYMTIWYIIDNINSYLHDTSRLWFYSCSWVKAPVASRWCQDYKAAGQWKAEALYFTPSEPSSCTGEENQRWAVVQWTSSLCLFVISPRNHSLFFSTARKASPLKGRFHIKNANVDQTSDPPRNRILSSLFTHYITAKVLFFDTWF